MKFPSHPSRSAFLGGLAFAVALTPSAFGQTSDALLNALIKKGVLTQNEAEAIQREAAVAEETQRAPQFNLRKSINEMELFGDVRLRYEFREAQNDASDTYSRERFRYRVRAGIRGSYRDDFYYGLRIETGASPRSPNVTLGDDGGPFSKGSDGLHIGQAYLGWRGLDWLSLEVGRLPNPLETSVLIWDGDLNPEGAAQRLTYELGSFELFATFGQFLYDDNNPENPIGAGLTASDDFLLAWQAGAEYAINDRASVRAAPVLYHYTGGGDSHGFAGKFSTANPGAINDLLVFHLPVSLDFRVRDFPLSVFGEFAFNLDGEERAKRSGWAGARGEDQAYRAGLTVGKLSGKGTWSGAAFWQHQELFALDPNLLDSDLFDVSLNMEGWVISGTYAVSDSVFATVTYALADRIDSGLPSLGPGGSIRTGDNLNDYQLLQLDLSWRF